MTTPTAAHTAVVIVGSDEHGVVRHARAVAAATGARVCRATRWSTGKWACRLPPRVKLVHVHFTDRLFATDPTASAFAFGALVEQLAPPCVVSVHDVPRTGGAAYEERRRPAYAAVAEAATTVIVASEHEAQRLRACGVDGPIDVIPLPIDVAARRGRTAAGAPFPDAPVVAVLGFLYPGKGHDDVLAAMGSLPASARLVAVGRPSDGHEPLADELAIAAAGAGRCFEVTGFLSDAELAARLAQVDVPVVANREPSASASLHTWISAGRRPLVAASPLASELAAAAPGLVRLYDPAAPNALGAALREALADPASTWCRPQDVPHRYLPAGVAAAHARVYAAVPALR